MLAATTIEAWSTAISIPLAVIGTFVAVTRYLNDKKKAYETARLEVRRPFYQKQQEAYLALVEITSIIANRYGRDDWETAFVKFWVMFWGVVPIVADEEVSAAVDRFADTLDNLSDGVSMRNASMNLARACRNSLGESWSVDFQRYDKSSRAGRQ